MVCVHCGAHTRVINSRLQKRANSVWRRRQCQVCRAIFTTEEVARYQAAWTVADERHGRPPIAFERDKLFLSLYRSLEHRSTAVADASSLTDTVIQKVAAEVVNGSLSVAALRRTAQVALNRFDTVASVHYQAFHKPQTH